MELFNSSEQPELFEEFFQKKLNFLKRGPRFKKPYISISIENLIISSIALFMTMIICYSLGVESGKRRQAASSMPAASGGISDEETVLAVPETTRQSAEKPPEMEREAEPPVKMQLYYTVQLATYLQKSHAQRQVNLLKKKGLDAFILAGGKYYFLCSGKHPNYAAAKAETKKFIEAFRDCFVKKIEGQQEAE